jgi:hypothetical protein
MPSIALQMWESRARRALDEVESAHAAVGGAGRGRRFATRQVNHAYVVLLCSHFQRFCRDLHTEAADFLAGQALYAPVNAILHTRLIEGRRLSSGNANPGNLGSDFGRFGIDFWGEVRRRDRRNGARQKKLADLHVWRNAIAHQDFTSPELGGREILRVHEIRRWRGVCERLAVEFDWVMGVYLSSVIGVPPW